MKKVWKFLSLTALATSLITAPTVNAADLGLVKKTGRNILQSESSLKIDRFLNKLSPEQRKALQDLTSTTKQKLNISSAKDLNSSKEISVIVEFKQQTANTAILLEQLKGKALTHEDANKKLEASHDQFKKDLSKLKVKYKVRDTYKEAFNGVSITLPANQVKSLLQSGVVKSVYENKKVQLIEPISPLKEKESAVYSGKSPLEIMGVDKLHKKGITGKNVKIGVLDTGIDYNHPDLKRAFKGGYDFVDNDNDPMETTVDDWIKAGKPGGTSSGYVTYHGTHVSGIIAGQNKAKSAYAMEGVAPDANLYVYRVLGPYSTGSTEDILAGIEQSVKDKMDVINLSLGANYNDPYSPLAIGINNAVLSGVTCVLAAGNDGGEMYTLGTPAASALGITVGSSNPEVADYNYVGTFKSNSTAVDSEIHYATNGFLEDPRKLEGKSFDIVDVGQGLESDFNSKNVNGKIALVSTGITSLQDKVRLAKKYGAAAVFMYSTSNGFVADQVPVAIENTYAYILSGEQGKAFKEILKNEKAKYTFTTIQKKVFYTEDSLSFFSSRGPALVTYDIKPEVTAPGMSIMSTIPPYVYGDKYDGLYQYGYAPLSGTSMATPEVTGVAALLLEENPKATPADIKTTLMNTADDMNGNYSVFEVGAGRINALKAINSETLIQVQDKTTNIYNNEEVQVDDLTGALSFGSLYSNGEAVQDKRNVILQNNKNKEKIFEIKVSYQTVRDSLDATANGVKLRTSRTFVTLKGKSKQNIEASIELPASAKYGMYEGIITFTNVLNPDETYKMPFGARKVKEGIEYLNTSSGISTINNGNLNYNSMASATLKLNSHIRSIDIFIADTKSKDFGYLGYYDGVGIPENQDIKLTNFFDGDYYPIGITNEQAVGMEPTQIKPGTYKVKFVFTEESGKQLIIEKPISVDNSKPEMNTNLADGIIEVDPNNPIEIKGNVMDQGIKELIATGSEMTQGSNKLYYKYNTNYPTTQPLDTDGNFTFVRNNIPSSLTVLPIEMYAMDYIGNKSNSLQYYFVKKGAPYVTSIANHKEVFQGDTITFDVNAMNQGVFKNAELEFKYDPNVLSFNNIALVDNMKNRFDANVTNENGTIKVNLQAKDTSWSPENVISMLKLTATVKNDKYFNDYTKVTLSKANFTSLSDVKTSSGRVDPSVKINAMSSQIVGTMNGEAVYKVAATGPVKLFDYSKMGATVKVIDQNGMEYVGKVLDTPNFQVDSLPSGDSFMLVLDIPGHFTVQKSFYIGLDGKIGEKKFIDKKLASAGDVNKDNVIDILDAIYLQEHWGTNDRKGDINFDGKIDLTDMNYIKQNFLKENLTVAHQNKPKSTDNGKTLQDIIDSLN
ncbi:S8 family serine peptidase [Gottfriedia sp. S16(2024)]|uniref:S8 family serine peptidase n=1 Tax=Gottfriedia sp. S16(2024) TaxID=3162883 RepID=UPI003D1C3232